MRRRRVTSRSCRGRVPNSGWSLPGQLVDHELVAHLRVDRGNVAVLDPGHNGAGLGGPWRVAVLVGRHEDVLSGAVDGERGAVFAGAEGCSGDGLEIVVVADHLDRAVDERRSGTAMLDGDVAARGRHAGLGVAS